MRVVKSYVRREGRMTPGQKQGLLQHWTHYGLEVAHGPISFEAVFGNTHPVVLEIGFGMGQSLLTLALQSPQDNFVGIEVHRPGVGKLLSQLQAHSVKNVRVYQEDAVPVLQQCISDHTLQKILIYFPDPWPKLRHHKRRIIQPPFVALLWQKLVMGGEVYLATDWEAYAHHMLQVFTQSEGWLNQSKTQTFIDRPLWRPVTKFEARGKRLGHGVWDLCFKKTAVRTGRDLKESSL